MPSPVPFVAVRTAGLVLLYVALWWAGGLLPSEGGADIGHGLLTLALPALVAGIAAARDGHGGGRSGGRLLPLVVGWAVVAVLFGAATAVWISVGGALTGGGFYAEVLLGDLRSVAPFTAVVVGVPALLALTVAHSGTRPAGSAVR